MLFREVDIEFPDQGLVLVTGVVGVGKTGIGESLARSILGLPGRVSALGRYSTHKQGDTFARISCELRGKPLKIDLGYKAPEFPASTGEALSYSYDGKPGRQRAKLPETQAEIASMVRISPDLAKWTVFVDGDKLQFNQLSQEDSVNLIMAALAQPPWTKLHERARTTANKFEAARDTAAVGLETAKDNLAFAESAVTGATAGLKSARESYAREVAGRKQQIQEAETALATHTKALGKIENRQKLIKAQIEKMIAEHADEHKRLEIEANESDDRVYKLQEEKTSLINKQAADKAKVSQAQQLLNEMLDVPANCPTCGKPWDKAHSEAELRKQRQTLALAVAAHDKSAGDVRLKDEQINQERTTAKTARNRIANLIKDKTVELRDEYVELEAYARETNQEARAAELTLERLRVPPNDSDVKVAESQLSERKIAVEKARGGLETAAVELSTSQETLKVGKYWQSAFSPGGIPNMILEEAVGPLNEISRAISRRIYGGRLVVVYETTKNLADGREKATLNINIENKAGSNDLAMTSKGQRGLVNFIIAETLAEVGNISSRIGFRWFDEVLPHQDPELCHSIYAHMRENAQRHGTLVFLVDHNPAAVNYADYVLAVEEKDGESSVAWR